MRGCLLCISIQNLLFILIDLFFYLSSCPIAFYYDRPLTCPLHVMNRYRNMYDCAPEFRVMVQAITISSLSAVDACQMCSTHIYTPQDRERSWKFGFLRDRIDGHASLNVSFLIRRLLWGKFSVHSCVRKKQEKIFILEAFVFAVRRLFVSFACNLCRSVVWCCVFGNCILHIEMLLFSFKVLHSKFSFKVVYYYYYICGIDYWRSRKTKMFRKENIVNDYTQSTNHSLLKNKLSKKIPNSLFTSLLFT